MSENNYDPSAEDDFNRYSNSNKNKCQDYFVKRGVWVREKVVLNVTKYLFLFLIKSLKFLDGKLSISKIRLNPTFVKDI